MSENLNWLDRLKNSFDGFEPNVQSNWSAFESKLDGLVKSSGDTELMRQVKSAQRFAFGATTVAAGLALWMVSPWLFELSEENENEGAGITELVLDEVSNGDSNGETAVPWQNAQDQRNRGEISFELKLDPRLAAESASDWNGVEKPVMGARTSTTFVLNLPETTVRGKGNKTSASGLKSGSAESSHVGVSESFSDEAKLAVSTENEDHVGHDESVKVVWAASNSEESEDLADFNVSVQEACAGTAVSFSLNGLDRKGSVLWNFGDGGFSQDLAPTHVYDNAGTYDITVSVRAPGDGTIRTRTVENMIVVRPKPEARMRWEFPNANPHRATVKLLDETDGASSSTWLIEQNDLLNSEVMLDIPGEYHVNLVASNAFGCQDVAVDDIKLGSRKEAIAPALFSPDGDDRYDTFMPLLVMDFAGDWSLTIWDGSEEVFETSNEFEPWNGRLPNGIMAPKGKKFVWKLETRTEQGERNLFVDEVLIDG